jgi:type VI secretion system secreted protein Hcp
MAVDAYIYFEKPGAGGVQPEGETTDKYFKEKKAFEIKEFSFDIENATTIGSASGGAAAGRTKFNVFNIKKATDQASPLFFQNCVAGIHYGEVTLAIRKSGASPTTAGEPFLKYIFGTVFTTKISWTGPGDEAPEETIDFVYGTLQIKYTPQTPTGVMGVEKPAGWSQIANTVYP